MISEALWEFLDTPPEQWDEKVAELYLEDKYLIREEITALQQYLSALSQKLPRRDGGHARSATVDRRREGQPHNGPSRPSPTASIWH